MSTHCDCYEWKSYVDVFKMIGTLIFEKFKCCPFCGKQLK